MLLLVIGTSCFAAVWIIYPTVIAAIASIKQRSPSLPHKRWSPECTIILAAHNEAARIADRLTNIVEQKGAFKVHEIIVVSDGSKDNTIDIARSMNSSSIPVKVIEVLSQSGKAAAHNLAVPKATTDLLVFTDADTIFEPGCLDRLVHAFKDLRVGYASGVIKWRNQRSNQITESAGFYWRFEKSLRRWETILGLNCFGTGAVCAIRSDLYRPIPPTGDIDFTSPLDVRLQHFKCVQVDDAIVTDEMPPNARLEFRSRIRMTSKNFFGTITRWGVSGIVRHPILTAVILLHKIGRWCTPISLGLILVGSLMLLPTPIGFVLISIQILCAVFAALGAISIRVPGAGPAWGFVLINIAFAIGIIRVLIGRIPVSYRPIESGEKM